MHYKEVDLPQDALILILDNKDYKNQNLIKDVMYLFVHQLEHLYTLW
jgi:hypothetical protein